MLSDRKSSDDPRGEKRDGERQISARIIAYGRVETRIVRLMPHQICAATQTAKSFSCIDPCARRPTTNIPLPSRLGAIPVTSGWPGVNRAADCLFQNSYHL